MVTGILSVSLKRETLFKSTCVSLLSEGLVTYYVSINVANYPWRTLLLFHRF